MNPDTEFDRQVSNLLDKGYPKMAGITSKKFSDLLNPLKEKLSGLKMPEVDIEKGSMPFVIVVKSELVSTEKAMTKAEKEGKKGITKLTPLKPAEFEVLKEISLPQSPAYLLIDIDRGRETLNITPKEAFERIKKEKRSPLTIDEGIAIVTHFPEFLMKNNCFSLLASRTGKDKRVPAIWINAKKEPNLGWCWEGNPHTWLGSASCSFRVGL